MNYLGASNPSNFKFGSNILYNTILDTTIYGPTGPKGETGKGFTVFATTTTYSGLNSIIATGGNVGEFVIVTGGDLFLYMGTGSGQTGPGNSYNYSGDITDESKLIGTTGPTGPYGKTGPAGPTGNIGPQGPTGSSFTIQNFGNYKILVSTGTNNSVAYDDFVYNGSGLGVGTTTPSGIITAKQPHLFNIASNSGSYSILGTHDVDGSLNTRIVVSGSTRGINGGGIEYLTSTGSLGSHVWYTFPTLEKMRLTPDGKLGIGLSNPDYTLDVNGNSRVVNNLVVSGNVGIGTTTPGFKLDVNGGTTAIGNRFLGTHNASDLFWFGLRGTNASETNRLFMGAETLNIADGLVNNLRFLTNGSERMRIDSNGNVGIGTSTPSVKLDVSSTASFGTTAQFFMPNLSVGNTNEIRVGISSSNYSYLSYNQNGTMNLGNESYTILQGKSTGEVYIPSLSGYGEGYLYVYADQQIAPYFSDIRVKNSIEYVSPSGSLSQILALQPATFKINIDPYSYKLGFIAQDVETIIPEAVDAKKYEYQFLKTSTGSIMLDENGIPMMDMTKPRYKTLDHNAIVATLVNAMKEQTQIIQQQRQEIDTLKQNYADLVNILKQKNILP